MRLLDLSYRRFEAICREHNKSQVQYTCSSRLYCHKNYTVTAGRKFSAPEYFKVRIPAASSCQSN